MKTSESLPQFQPDLILNATQQKEFVRENTIYFKLLLITIGLASFSALLVYVIQNQNTQMLGLMGAVSCINLFSLAKIKILKLYLRYIFPMLYVLYLAALVVVVQYGTQVPFFVLGYTNGVLFSTLTLVCPQKAQIIFLIGTPWILLGITNIFQLLYFPYILFMLFSSVLLGIVCYYKNDNQKKIKIQDIIIKKQHEIIRECTNDYLLVITYNEEQQQFELEFANTLFENTYHNDFKDTLRTYQVMPEIISLNQQKHSKHETLEEYLFEMNKQKIMFLEKSSFNLKLMNKQDSQIQEAQIIRAAFLHTVYIITIKINSTVSQEKEYKQKIYEMKQSIISLSTETGYQLQNLYSSIDKARELNRSTEIKKLLLQNQSDLLFVLNRMKNYIIYYQREKLKFENSLIGCYSLNAYFQAIESYFDKKCFQRNRQFRINYSSFLVKTTTIRLNQKLLTQVLVNIFNYILNLSSKQSTIQLMITFEEDQKFQLNKSLRSPSSNEHQNSKEQSSNQIMQLQFIFSTDYKIEEIDRQLCQNSFFNKDLGNEQMIVSSVNYFILRMISPHNEIYWDTHKAQNLGTFQNIVSLHVYTDQTKLEPSYIKLFQSSV